MSNTPLPTFAKITKWVFILFNILFAICGLILLAVGGWVVSIGSNQQVNSLTGGNVVGGGVVIILCAIATFVIAAIGVVGALFQLRPFLVAFGVCLIIIVVIEIIVAIVGFAFISSSSEDAFRNAINNYSDNNNDRTFVDTVQNTFVCCGASGPDDWNKTSFVRKNEKLPDSCCNLNSTVTTCNYNSPSLHKTGCVAATGALIRQNAGSAAALGAVCFIIGLAEILGIVLSFGLCCCIHRNKLQVV